MSEKTDDLQSSTLAALLREKPKRGRPRHPVSRQNVYVSLTKKHKEIMKHLSSELPEGIVRADVPDIAITILTVRLDALHNAVSDRNRAIPEGVTDLDSLYLLWDLTLPANEETLKWTSIRVSPQQALELGRVQGTLNAAFGTNRSQTFALALSLLEQYLEDYPLPPTITSIEDIRRQILANYL